MGFATAGFFARIFRFRRFGHHSEFASPTVGCVRPGRTGHSPSGVAPSTTTGSWFSDIGIPSGLGGSRRHGGAGGGTGRAQAPVDDLGLVDRETVVVRRGQAGS